MNKWKSSYLFIRPSLFSGFAIVAVVVFLALSGAYDLYKSYPFIRDYSYSLELIRSSVSSEDSAWSAVKGTVFSSPVINQAIFIGFWSLVGFISYSICFGLYYWFKDTKEQLRIHSFDSKASTDKTRKVLGLVNKVFLRLVITVAWIIYSVIYAQFIVPVSTIGFSTVESNGWTAGWFHILLGFILLLVTTHLHVIFLRLLMLRPRVFGGEEAILLESYKR